MTKQYKITVNGKIYDVLVEEVKSEKVFRINTSI